MYSFSVTGYLNTIAHNITAAFLEAVFTNANGLIIKTSKSHHSITWGYWKFDKTNFDIHLHVFTPVHVF